MTSVHSRQESFASSYVSSSAYQGGSSRHQHAGSKRSPVKIGPWKLGATLGKGATGRVFLATNTKNGQKAAVKVVSKSTLSAEPERAAAKKDADDDDETKGCDSAGLSYGIEREIIIMKLLNHPNVLRLYDVWETEKALYLVLEYVEGGELFDLLVESGPLPERTAVSFFRQIILGASYCHSLGICHRDLKPENLLLDKDYNIKIADFGMAALESTDRLLETSCGSPHYAAPEIVSGLRYHGAASDVWSCGVILFALLTGRLPFDDENIRDLLLKVQKGRYEIVEDVSPEARDLISQMLTVDPEQRIHTRDILHHPLMVKYFGPPEDTEEYRALPAVGSAAQPVADSAEGIDSHILENLVTLWHGRKEEDIVKALLSTEETPEKTFYSLLMRYRHDHSSEGTDQLVRSSSVISRATTTTDSPVAHRRHSQGYAASSAHNRPVSFSSRNTSSSSNTVPPLPEGETYREYLRQNRSTPSTDKVSPKRNSMLLSDSPSARRSASRASLLLADSKSRNSLILSDSPQTELGVRARRASKMKRNSITTRLLSTYARMAEEEETNKKSVNEYGKRTSADFGKLCDVLFGGADSKSSNTIPNSESMATINAIVFDSPASRRASRRISTTTTKNSKSRRKSRHMSTRRKSSTMTNKRSSRRLSKLMLDSKRSTSDPIERISRLLNAKELDDLDRRVATTVSETSNSKAAAPPPKPASRLDPRYKAYEAYMEKVAEEDERRQKAEEARLKKLEEERLKKEKEERLRKEAAEKRKLEDEKIRREAAEKAAAERAARAEEEDDLDDDYDQTGADAVNRAFGRLSHTGTVRERRVPTRLADVKIPQLTRQSKAFPNEKRYSVLSLYSTKDSSNRLSYYMRELDDELRKSSDPFGTSRSTRLSMLPLEEDDDDDQFETESDTGSETECGDSDTETPRTDTAEEEDAFDTVDMDIELDDNGTVGAKRNTKRSSKRASQRASQRHSDVRTSQQSDDLCFVDTTKPAAGDINLGTPELNYRSSKASMCSDSNPEAYKSMRLPEIPGSPIKEEQKRKSQGSDFKIYNEKPEKQQGKSPAATPKMKNESMIPLEVQKQSTKNQSDALKPASNNAGNKQSTAQKPRKSSFLRKLSKNDGKENSNQEQRKSSFSQIIKRLFSGEVPEKELSTKLTQQELYEAMKSLLYSWKPHGLKNIKCDETFHTIVASVAKENSMDVKPCTFECKVIDDLENNSPDVKSTVVFTCSNGSGKTFKKLTSEIQEILEKESVYVS